MDGNSENQGQGRQISREEFIPLRKMESLAQQVAQQAVRIADLETENDLLRRELTSQSQSPPQIQEPTPQGESAEESDQAEGVTEDTPVSH